MEIVVYVTVVNIPPCVVGHTLLFDSPFILNFPSSPSSLTNTENRTEGNGISDARPGAREWPPRLLRLALKKRAGVGSRIERRTTDIHKPPRPVLLPAVHRVCAAFVVVMFLMFFLDPTDWLTARRRSTRSGEHSWMTSLVFSNGSVLLLRFASPATCKRRQAVKGHSSNIKLTVKTRLLGNVGTCKANQLAGFTIIDDSQKIQALIRDSTNRVLHLTKRAAFWEPKPITCIKPSGAPSDALVLMRTCFSSFLFRFPCFSDYRGDRVQLFTLLTKKSIHIAWKSNFWSEVPRAKLDA